MLVLATAIQFLSPMVWAVAGQVPLPGTSSVSVFLSPPAACVDCHGDFDAEGSAWGTWVGSPMGHAARNPLFLAALTEAEKDDPGVGDFCLRCHAPEAWLSGRCVDTGGLGLLPEDSGVTCSVCHRMEPSPWVRNGQYLIADDSTLRGPYSDSVSPHGVRESTWIGDARLCGACHDLMNPRVERRSIEGGGMGVPFPEQTTYSEWSASAFSGEGITCQKCHMPEGSGAVVSGGPIRPDRSSHAFSGGNRFSLDAIAFLEPSLGVAEELARGREKVRAMLESAAELSVRDGPSSVERGVPFTFTVRVENSSGHKLPTGYVAGRRVFLSATAPDLGLSLGAFDALRGDPIAPPRVWLAVHGQHKLGPGDRLPLNDTVFFDNRIPPRGFVPTATTAPVGATYPADSLGVLAHWDDLTITATAPCALLGSDVEIRLQLWYQSTTKSHVERLVDDNGADPRGARLAAAFLEVGADPIEMERLDLSIPLASGSACDAPAGDGGWDGGGDPSDGAGAESGFDAGADDGGASGCSCRAHGGRRSWPSADWVFSVMVGIAVFPAWRRRWRRSS